MKIILCVVVIIVAFMLACILAALAVPFIPAVFIAFCLGFVAAAVPAWITFNFMDDEAAKEGRDDR
jgi:uncharacterized membrane protein